MIQAKSNLRLWVITLVLSQLPALAIAQTIDQRHCPDTLHAVDFGIWSSGDSSKPTLKQDGIVLSLKDPVLFEPASAYAQCQPGQPPGATPLVTIFGITRLNFPLPTNLNIVSAPSLQKWKRITNYPSPSLFNAWRNQERSQSLTGSGYDCLVGKMHTPNDVLNYACFVESPDTRILDLYVRCNKWDRCLAQFGTKAGLGFRVSLPQRPDARTGPSAIIITQELSLWRDYVSRVMNWFEARQYP